MTMKMMNPFEFSTKFGGMIIFTEAKNKSNAKVLKVLEAI